MDDQINTIENTCGKNKNSDPTTTRTASSAKGNSGGKDIMIRQFIPTGLLFKSEVIFTYARRELRSERGNVRRTTKPRIGGWQGG